MLDPAHIDLTRLVTTLLAGGLVAWFLAIFVSFAIADFKRYRAARVRAYRPPTQRRRHP